jgi:hypothetical protein
MSEKRSLLASSSSSNEILSMAETCPILREGCRERGAHSSLVDNEEKLLEEALLWLGMGYSSRSSE